MDTLMLSANIYVVIRPPTKVNFPRERKNHKRWEKPQRLSVESNQHTDEQMDNDNSPHLVYGPRGGPPPSASKLAQSVEQAPTKMPVSLPRRLSRVNPAR